MLLGTFAWEKLKCLRALTYFQLIFMVPFFLFWTIYGNYIFFRINEGSANCETDNNDTFAFIIFWFILSYVLMFCYMCLLLFGFSSAQKSAQVKKSMLQLLRKLNGSEMGEAN